MKTPQEWIDQTDGVRNAPHALMYVRDIAAIQADARSELEAQVSEFCSAQRIIEDAMLMDNYTDAARARDRQARIVNAWLARTAPKEPEPNVNEQDLVERRTAPCPKHGGQNCDC